MLAGSMIHAGRQEHNVGSWMNALKSCNFACILDDCIKAVFELEGGLSSHCVRLEIIDMSRRVYIQVAKKKGDSERTYQNHNQIFTLVWSFGHVLTPTFEPIGYNIRI